MAFDFPASPTNGQTFTPAGGATYIWNGTVWLLSPDMTRTGVITSDSPPPSPIPGQLWFQSSTGNTYIWYVDVDSAAWVQFNVAPPPANDPPNDGNHYVRAGNTWRMVSQSANIAGVSQYDFNVPTWGPTKARLTGSMHVPSISGMNARLSVDGTTFAAGASDYQLAGFVHRPAAPGTAVSNVPTTGTNLMALTGNFDHTQVPISVVADFNIVRVANTDLFGWRSRGSGYNFNSAILYETDMYHGWVVSSAFAGTASIKAIRWLSGGAAPRAGNLTMEWLP